MIFGASATHALRALAHLAAHEGDDAILVKLRLQDVVGEAVLEAGLTQVYGVKEVQLTNISDGYLRETYRLVAVVRDARGGRRAAALGALCQLSEDQIRGLLQTHQPESHPL